MHLTSTACDRVRFVREEMPHIGDGIWWRKERNGCREFRDSSCKKEVTQTAKESRINITVMTRRNRRNFRNRLTA